MREQFYRGAAARHIKCCLCVNNSIGVLLPNNNLFGASAAALYPTINRGCWPMREQFYRGAAYGAAAYMCLQSIGLLPSRAAAYILEGCC